MARSKSRPTPGLNHYQLRCQAKDLVIEFHYEDGDVGAHEYIDGPWLEFSSDGDRSHILIRPNTDAGQELSNRLHEALKAKPIWIATWRHRHGSDVFAFYHQPSEEAVVKAITDSGSAWEPERGESIDINELEAILP